MILEEGAFAKIFEDLYIWLMMSKLRRSLRFFDVLRMDNMLIINASIGHEALRGIKTCFNKPIFADSYPSIGHEALRGIKTKLRFCC